ncbi:hypothetical protein CDAR_16331 [Caerostris darwini]|uniref:Uncharacterized protein n=1 Tax=Caerostris darwini TaxID=1538125 RepID=A0AAV4WS89_9ARAC|nr:hypothetical protein CDAR_16331 [Caerostris darwini]
MPLKEIAMPQKTRLPNEHKKRQDEIRNETSEVKQSRLINIGERTAEESKTEQQGRLERNRLSKLKIQLLKKSEENERKRQYMREFYQRVKATETEEQRESRLERQRVRNRRIRQTETEEQREKRLENQRARMRRVRERETEEKREKRLESQRVRDNRNRQKHQSYVKKDWRNNITAETQEQRMERLEKYRKLNTRRKNVVKNKEDVMPVEPTVVIKEEPIQSYPERLASEDKDVKDNGYTVPVKPTVVIIGRPSLEPISFDPGPSASADIVIKDEFIVCSEDDTGSFADVPSSTVPTSHVLRGGGSPRILEPLPGVAYSSMLYYGVLYDDSSIQLRRVLKQLSKHLEMIKIYFDNFGEYNKLKRKVLRRRPEGCWSFVEKLCKSLSNQD